MPKDLSQDRYPGVSSIESQGQRVSWEWDQLIEAVEDRACHFIGPF